MKIRNIDGIISFDMDGTLDDDFDGTINMNKLEIQSICRHYVLLGKDVWIVTKRYSPSNYKLGIGNEHVKVEKMAKDLGVTKIYYTNREYKHEILVKLGIHTHFENSENEVYMIEKTTKIEVIPVEDPYWRDKVYI